MKINIEHGIPFIEAIFKHTNKEIAVSNVLIDTGAASSIISVDIALEIGLGPSPTDIIHRVRGVGGYEYVYEKVIESITAPNIDISNFVVEVGDMDYGFNINAILGTDFLRRAKAKIDMENLTLTLNM